MARSPLDFTITEVFDPSNDEWIVVQVWPDGNPHELCRFATEDEAADFADAEMRRHMDDNSQFGVGA